MKEIFKDIIGFEGYYQISNLGRVKSLKRTIPHPYTGYQTFKEKILLYILNNHGYSRVNLSKKGFRRSIQVHHLVWDNFGKSKRNGHKLQVDHIDENKLNNRIDNLQLLTPRQNTSKRDFNRDTSSKYTGVYWDKSRNKWRAMIRIKGKCTHIGNFKTELEAAQAYQNKLKTIV